MDFTEHNAGEPDAAGGGEERVMPLGTGDDFAGGPEQSFDSLAAPPKRRLNGGGLVLAIVVLTAAGGLYSMRTLTKASAAHDAPSAVEQSIDEFLDGLMAGMSSPADAAAPSSRDGVLDVLTGSYTQRQVALSYVQRDPFIIFEEERTAAPAAPTKVVDPREQLRTERIRLFEQAGARIRVRMIMMGSPPMASIDNRIVRVGDLVPVEADGVDFRIEAIEAGHVALVAEDAALDVAVRIVVQLRQEQ